MVFSGEASQARQNVPQILPMIGKVILKHRRVFHGAERAGWMRCHMDELLFELRYARPVKVQLSPEPGQLLRRGQ
jgi:hypothetical protein